MTVRVLTVLGGTGSVGREVVRQAVAAGHVVNVVSRSRARVAELSQPVTFIDGDVTDAATVDRAVAPADAVISTLGHTSGSRSNLLELAITNAIAAMERHNVARIVVLTNTSVRSPDDAPTRRQQLGAALSRIFMRSVNSDHDAQAKVLTDSDTDWTMVRAPLLVDRLASGKYRVGMLDATIGPAIGRSDLAAFLLACALGDRHVRQMPVVSQERPAEPL